MSLEILSTGGALGPVSQRVVLLDVLRGCAILGILLANITGFSGYAFLSPQQDASLWASCADGEISQAMTALIEGKFYSLFSLLFGIGFAVILERCEQRGANPVRILSRRYFGLLAIGLIHSILIWYGDILVLYALLGLLLLAFRRLRVRALLWWAIGLLLSPIPLYALGLALQPATSDSGGPPHALIESLNAFRSGGYVEIVSGNLTLSTFNWLRRLILMFYPRVFGMFLLGVALGRMRILQNPEQHTARILALSRWGVLVGLPASVIYATLDQQAGMLPLTGHGLIRTIFDSVGTPLLCLAYVAWITQLSQKWRWQRPLVWFAPVGRMALSNYLMQSVCGALLFYGIGGGLFMRVSLAASLGIALAIFALQALLSRLWLSYFNFGPVEWVWRQLTYARRVALWRRV
jgi:uncharacterized protein